MLEDLTNKQTFRHFSGKSFNIQKWCKYYDQPDQPILRGRMPRGRDDGNGTTIKLFRYDRCLTRWLVSKYLMLIVIWAICFSKFLIRKLHRKPCIIIGNELKICSHYFSGKVHGSLARAGKVKGQTPKVKISTYIRKWHYTHLNHFFNC